MVSIIRHQTRPRESQVSLCGYGLRHQGTELGLDGIVLSASYLGTGPRYRSMATGEDAREKTISESDRYSMLRTSSTSRCRWLLYWTSRGGTEQGDKVNSTIQIGMARLEDGFHYILRLPDSHESTRSELAHNRVVILNPLVDLLL